MGTNISSSYKNIKFSLFICLTVFCFSSCNLDEFFEDDDEDKLTEEEWREIFETDSLISVSADSILISLDPIGGWNSKLDDYKDFKWVKDAYVYEGVLFIELKNGTGHSWMLTPTDTNLSIVESVPVPNLHKSENYLGKVCLVNAVSKDLNPLRAPFLLLLMNNLRNQFEAKGFSVDIINGSEADLMFFGSGLKGYEVIYIISHGVFWKSTTESKSYIVTGEEATSTKLKDDFYDPFDYITIPEFRYNINLGKLVIQFTDYFMYDYKYINSSYINGDFPSSIIYLVACQAYKQNSTLGEAFYSKGAGVTIGWDEANSKGPWTGEKLMLSLINGYTFGEAYDQLSAEDKKDGWCGLPHIDWYYGCYANLTYYPQDWQARDLTIYPANETGIPIILYPELGSSNIPLDLTLDWTSVDNANKYQVILSSDQEMNFLLINDNAIINNHYDIPDNILQPSTTYYWNVRAIVNDEPGSWSVKGYFTTKNNPFPSDEIIPLAVGNYWIYQPEGLPQTETVTILGSQEVQGVTCFEWFAQGDTYPYLYANRSDGCWCYGYGPHQQTPDLKYKYPVEANDTWVSFWVAPPYATTVTCLSTNASIGGYTDCILYNFYLPLTYHSMQSSSSLFQNKIDSLEGIDRKYSGFDIYDYYIPGIGMVGWETYLDGTLFVKAVLVDYQVNQ
jgi:hypothetical protein